MLRSIRLYFLFLLSLTLFGSCISNQQVALLQGEQISHEKLKTFSNTDFQYKLQAKDILSIRFKSIDPTSVANLNIQNNENRNSIDNQISAYTNGFSISDSGYIHIPDIGKVKVGGLTVDEARAFVQRRLDEDLIDATVIMNLLSFKISILGEVARPGYYHIYHNRGTILDGFALAGGFLNFANRKAVTLIRQTENGSEAIKIDLTNADIISSPYYYLRPNDALVVNPLDVKHTRSNLVNLNIAGIILSGISSAVSIITVIELIKN